MFRPTTDARRSVQWMSLNVLIALFVGCGPGSDPGAADPQEPPKRGVAYRTEPDPPDPDAPQEFTATPSGLQYRILRQGKGNPPLPNHTVYVHYVGRLEDGTEFDTTYKEGVPAYVQPINMISGWQEGLLLIGKGGMIELIIPPELGYKEKGITGMIPANATLRFTIELVEIF